MAKIVLELDSNTAEEVMFALKLRAVQKNAPSGSRALMEAVRKQVEDEGVKKLGWQDFPASGLPARYPVDNAIRVTVTTRNRW